MMNYLTGIADEAGQDLATQIRAHQELGWRHIELRTIDGVCITDVEDSVFDSIDQQLREAGISVSCFASQLANWARPIDTDFDVDIQELRRAIPRMKRMGTRFIRCMSYPNSDPPLPDAEWRSRAIERMSELTKIAAEGDVVLVHENCHGWASQGPGETLEMLSAVDSPHLKLVFDTGNPICTDDDAWQLYQQLRAHVVYVHIKDYTRLVRDDGTCDVAACFPGEGLGYVPEIVGDLLSRGYDDGFSIEPHIDSVIHLAQTASDPAAAFRTYVEYGRALERLLEHVRADV